MLKSPMSHYLLPFVLLSTMHTVRGVEVPALTAGSCFKLSACTSPDLDDESAWGGGTGTCNTWSGEASKIPYVVPKVQMGQTLP